MAARAESASAPAGAVEDVAIFGDPPQCARARMRAQRGSASPTRPHRRRDLGPPRPHRHQDLLGRYSPSIIEWDKNVWFRGLDYFVNTQLGVQG